MISLMSMPGLFFPTSLTNNATVTSTTAAIISTAITTSIPSPIAAPVFATLCHPSSTALYSIIPAATYLILGLSTMLTVFTNLSAFDSIDIYIPGGVLAEVGCLIAFWPIVLPVWLWQCRASAEERVRAGEWNKIISTTTTTTVEDRKPLIVDIVRERKMVVVVFRAWIMAFVKRALLGGEEQESVVGKESGVKYVKTTMHGKQKVFFWTRHGSRGMVLFRGKKN